MVLVVLLVLGILVVRRRRQFLGIRVHPVSVEEITRVKGLTQIQLKQNLKKQKWLQILTRIPLVALQ